MSYTDPFSPESILRPENLFGLVVEWRSKMLPESAGDAASALQAMEHIHPEREHRNRKLFISRVSRDMNVLATAGDVYSTHNPALASDVHQNMTPEQVLSANAHVAYVEQLSNDVVTQQPQVPDSIVNMSEARSRINDLHERAIAA